MSLSFLKKMVDSVYNNKSVKEKIDSFRKLLYKINYVFQNGM